MSQTVIDSKLRHEWKHHISPSDRMAVIQRLNAIAAPDEHYGDAPYHIRSLYFDNVYDKALSERMNGQEVREKFRIRYYNGDTSYIVLEKKEKFRDLCGKKSCRVTQQQVQRLIDGDWAWLAETGKPLCMELYAKMSSQLLRPRVIVDYTRKAYVYEPGNVRITLGAGMIPLAVFGSLIVGAVFVGMNHYKDDAVPYMLVLQCEDDAAEKAALISLSNSVKRYAVKSKTVSEHGIEDTIEVRFGQTSTSFVNEMRSLRGVRTATLVSYNGEYMS